MDRIGLVCLVPKLCMGTHLFPQLCFSSSRSRSFEDNCVPKPEFGHEIQSALFQIPLILLILSSSFQRNLRTDSASSISPDSVV